MADPLFPHPEQDASGNGDLPTYDALAAEAGPNSRLVHCPSGCCRKSQVAVLCSRFGRWRQWVEKRSASGSLTPASSGNSPHR